MSDEQVSAAPDVETPGETLRARVADIDAGRNVVEHDLIEPAEAFDLDAHLAERAEATAASEAANAMRALYGPDYQDKAAN